MPAAERAKLRGVSAARAGQIIAGAVVADTTMATLNVARAEICPWALREGIMLSHLEAITERTAEVPLQPVRHLHDHQPSTMSGVTPLHRTADADTQPGPVAPPRMTSNRSAR